MVDNAIDATILPPAPRGSKKNWPHVTTQVQPADHARLLSLVTRWRMAKTDVVARAVRELLDREAA